MTLIYNTCVFCGDYDMINGLEGMENTYNCRRCSKKNKVYVSSRNPNSIPLQ